jgi:hypothetical protein
MHGPLLVPRATGCGAAETWPVGPAGRLEGGGFYPRQAERQHAQRGVAAARQPHRETGAEAPVRVAAGPDYLIVRTQRASVSASASLTWGLAGIGI